MHGTFQGLDRGALERERVLHHLPFPLAHVGEVHLAGHAEDTDDNGARLLIDSHDRRVVDDVWRLYDRAVQHIGALPTLIEWDSDIPSWPVLFAECQRAETILASHDAALGKPTTHPVSHELA